MNKKNFNIRVYGLLINPDLEVLLADEYILDSRMTKFPGGGLKYGEGLIECMEREALEEFGQEIKVIEHFYTTDFFQKALYFENTQLLSIYYKIELKKPINFKISDKPFDFDVEENGKISFRWKSIEKISPDSLTFPIDRHVVELLKKEYIKYA